MNFLRRKSLHVSINSAIRSEKTSKDRMRKLLLGPIRSAGTKGKDALYFALKDTEACLIEDLEQQWTNLDIFTFNVFIYVLSN